MRVCVCLDGEVGELGGGGGGGEGGDMYTMQNFPPCQSCDTLLSVL